MQTVTSIPGARMPEGFSGRDQLAPGCLQDGTCRGLGSWGFLCSRSRERRKASAAWVGESLACVLWSIQQFGAEKQLNHGVWEKLKDERNGWLPARVGCELRRPGQGVGTAGCPAAKGTVPIDTWGLGPWGETGDSRVPAKPRALGGTVARPP